MLQSKVVAFAKALNTTPGYLMGWTDEDEEDESYKINDAISDIIVKLRKDSDFRDVVSSLYNLTPEQLNAVKTFLAAFK